MRDKVVVLVSGGLVQQIWTTTDMDVITLDADTDGIDDGLLNTIPLQMSNKKEKFFIVKNEYNNVNRALITRVFDSVSDYKTRKVS